MWATIKQWLSDTWYKSWSWLWGTIKIVAGLTFATGTYIGNIVNDPGVKDAFHQLSAPTWVGLGVAILGAITLLAMHHEEPSA